MTAENSQVLGDSKVIVTNQPGIHEKLVEVVTRHLKHPSQKPFQPHTENAFNEVDKRVQVFDGEIILDSCCGVGQSTRILAKKFPKALVIGVDKSAHRITRNVDEITHNDGSPIENFILVRADLNDFYRLVLKANWQVSRHYILYPNPWPKSKHLQRRWHGSAVFPTLIQIGQQIVLRSNWRLYLEEFQQAASLLDYCSTLTPVTDTQPFTPFEAKYQASGQDCWQLDVTKAQ